MLNLKVLHFKVLKITFVLNLTPCNLVNNLTIFWKKALLPPWAQKSTD